MLETIQCLHPPIADNGSDEIIWGPTPDGIFTTKSAFDVVSPPREDSHSAFFRVIWKWKGPERIRLFLWRVLHDSLMTNLARFERGLGPDSTCSICRQEEEDIIHVLRDYKFAKEVWSKIPGGATVSMSINGDFQSWIISNLTRNNQLTPNWSITFAFTLDSIWHRRNKLIFLNSILSVDQVVEEIRMRVDSFFAATSTGEAFMRTPLFSSDHWKCPPERFIKLNGDGAVTKDGYGSCGGVVRDSEGRFIIAFSKSLGRYSIIQSELWALLLGLRLIQNHHLGGQISIESDSKEAVKLIEEGCNRGHPCYDLVKAINDLTLYLSVFSYSYIAREANLVADKLARHRSRLEENMTIFHSPPSFILSLLVADNAVLI
uniref:Ribonuclease H protein At1g65750 family n=1 Tax=Cajanus cajan TaxID=3821 RepID=A0A151TVA2_CAJCA|nr:Putative ribonuclease H protein At1g65750 family [Cajanus cajan]